jgi:hypothetical protein
MLRRRAGTSNPRRAVLRAAVADGLPIAREDRQPIIPGHADLGLRRESLENISTRSERHRSYAIFTAHGTARPRVHFAPQESTPLQRRAL